MYVYKSRLHHLNLSQRLCKALGVQNSMYVYMYVCNSVYVGIYVCMYVRMYVCVCMYVWYVCMYVCR